MPPTPLPPHVQLFDPRAPCTITRRHLPHLRQAGATYFVTARLADAIPPEEIKAQLRLRHKLEQEGIPEDELVRRIVQEIERNLDRGYGACWFKRAEFAKLVTGPFHHFDKQRYHLGCYCVMGNHYHVVLTPMPGQDLTEIVRTWNRHSAGQLRGQVEIKGRVWYDEAYDSIPRSTEHLANILQYIGRNPWKAHVPEAHWIRWVAPEWEALNWTFRDEPNRGRYKPR